MPWAGAALLVLSLLLSLTTLSLCAAPRGSPAPGHLDSTQPLSASGRHNRARAGSARSEQGTTRLIRCRNLIELGARRALAAISTATSMSQETVAAAPPDPASTAAAAGAKAAALHHRLAMSGGSRKINQKLTSDELTAAKVEISEGKTVSAAAASSSSSAMTTAAAVRTRMDRSHLTASFLAGVGSGVLASIVCAPLDLIRTRMQVMGEVRNVAAASGRAAEVTGSMPSLSIYRALGNIIRQDGIRGCFRGLGATLATVPTFWGIYFPLYEELKRELHGVYDRRNGVGEAVEGGSPCPAIVHMGSAIVAGAVADFVCNPMFLVRTRMQTEALHYYEQPLVERRPHGVWRTIRNLYAEGGIPVFWRGLTASLMGLSHVAIQFPVYEFLKAEARADSPEGEESAADLLLASGVAKMCASLVTYPHEVIRSRMMDARGAEAGKNVFATARRVVGNEGLFSLYTGIHVSLLRVVPNCCITFMSYELILRWAKEHASQ